MSQAQKEKNKLSPKKQVQGDHEGIKRPKRLKAQTKKHREEKETHGKRLSSQDPQQPSRGADPSRHTVKRKTRTARKKLIEKENKKQSKRTQAPVKPSDLSWHKQKKTSGNQNRETQKKENGNRRLLSWQNRIPPRWEKKKGKVELPDGEAEKGIPQHIPKKVAN